MIRPLALATVLLWAAGSAASELPPFVVQWPDTTGDVLIAETDTYSLHRYYRSDDGSLAVDSKPMSIGQNGAGKKREGDLKTPYGVYFVVDRLDTASLHPKYGSAAFPLDYPSARDRQLGRTGSGIWLHGVLPGTVEPIPRDTDGCIAISNSELDALASRIDVLSTPVIVTRSMGLGVEPASPSLRQQLVRAVDRWTASLSDGRLDKLLEYYSPEFSYQGLSLDDFAVLQLDESTSEAVRRISYQDLFIAADPADAGVFVSRFTLAVELKDGGRREQRKRLYWRRDSAGVFRVIAEDEA